MSKGGFVALFYWQMSMLMSMILDPTNVLTSQISNDTYLTGDLPKLTDAQLAFGYLPNVEKLLPGDLLLIQKVNKTLVGRAISAAQRGLHPGTAHEWTHVAIYARNWLFIEATPQRNIASNSIIKLMPDHKLLVRRGSLLCDCPQPQAAVMGMTIVMEAALQMEAGRYSKIAAVVAGILARMKRTPVNSPIDRYDSGSLICSTLYEKCYNLATDGHLLNTSRRRDNEHITPAVLAGIGSMIDVDVGWKKLV